MTRALLHEVLQDTDGDIQSGTSVQVLETDGVTPFGQVIYVANSGVTTLSNPLTTDTTGRIIAYADNPQRVILKVGTSSYLSEFRNDPATILTASSPTLTTPTLTGPIISDAISFTEQGSAPSTPLSTVSKLYIGSDNHVYMLGSNGTPIQLTESGQAAIVNADIAAGAAIALSKLAAVTNNQVLIGNGTAVTSALLLNANIDPAAAIALSKLAAGSSGVLKSNGSAITAGNKVANSDLLVPRQATLAVGSTSDPTTSSATYVDLPQMSATLTTTGGAIRVDFHGTFQNGAATGKVHIAASLDGAAEVGEVRAAEPIAAADMYLGLTWYFTGVSAGSHTVKIRWKVTAGTATAVTTLRQMLAVECAV